MAADPNDMEVKYQQMLLAQTPGKRVAMGCSMFSAAKALVRAGIMSECQGREPADLRIRIFVRLYGDDFDVKTREAIVKWLSTRGCQS